MRNKEKLETVELNWNDVILLANGTDSDGMPRSAGTFGLDKIINENELENIKEVFLRDAIINMTLRGNVAVITLEFNNLSHVAFDQTKKICEEWLNNLNNEEYDDHKLTLTVVPYLLCGQAVFVFDGLCYCESYTIKKERENVHHITLVFDNQYTKGFTTDEIDYDLINANITQELIRYERQVEEELENAILDEQEALKEENAYQVEMQKRLNNPMEEFEFDSEERKKEDIRDSEEEQRYRFSDDD